MGLRDDMDALERAIEAGKGKEWMRGEYVNPPEPMPTDRSASAPSGNTYRFICQRGD